MLPARAAVLAIVLACLSAAPASAQDPVPSPTPVPTVTPTPSPEPRIGQGVSAAGVDVSNLTISEATAKLQDAFAAAAGKAVVVSVAGKRFRLPVKKASLVFDAQRTAKRAYYAGENRPAPPPGGAPAPVDVTLAITFKRGPIRDFALKIDKKVKLAPRDASVRITLTRMIKRHSKTGRDLNERKLRATIEAALADPRLPRRFTPGRDTVQPRVKVKDLPRLYGTVITIDQSSFRLRLFKRLRLSKTYGVAVGLPAYPTPNGLYSIQNKQVNPTWTAPNSPWAGEMAGQSVSGGAPNNPLKARWMGIVNGVGIHGTGQEYSIGSRASHGCIRMRVADVIDLYPRVPVGTRVLIAP